MKSDGTQRGSQIDPRVETTPRRVAAPEPSRPPAVDFETTPRQVEAAGTRFDYNDINAQLLGMAVARATGMRYSEYLEQALWQPLGPEPARVWLDWRGGVAMSACCLISPARNWARIGLLLKDYGRYGKTQILPADWVEQMITPNRHSPYYGFQVWLGYEAEANPRPGSGGYGRTEYQASGVHMYLPNFCKCLL